MKTLNQMDLIASLSAKIGLTKVKTKEALEAFGEVVLEAVKDGASVTVPVLGRFVPKVTKARSCVNPRTRAMMKVPEKNKMAFSASATVKNALAGKPTAKK